MPDANTLWDFREALIATCALERLFSSLDEAITGAGDLPMAGQIVDATLVSAPRQRNIEAKKAVEIYLDQGRRKGGRDLARQAGQGAPEGFRTMVRNQGAKSLFADGFAAGGSFAIGALAAAGGVGVETIRFYPRRGLLRTPVCGGGVRHYGQEDVRRLRFIRQAQAAGFTLEEIRELLELDAGEDRGRARELAKTRIEVLDAKIADLQRARDALRRLASECAEGSTGPCPILASFEV